MDAMSKRESIIIGIFVGIACPLLTFVAFWWISACIYLVYIPRMPLGVIVATALTGLAIGCLLDVAFLRRWVKGFYTLSVGVAISLYLVLSVVAVAFFMGIPIGTFVLGLSAAAYVGRREHHRRVDKSQVTPALRKVALLAASVTTATAFPIGIFALREPGVVKMFETVPGLSGVPLIVFLCFLLFMMQYWLSQRAGYIAFRIGKGHA